MQQFDQCCAGLEKTKNSCHAGIRKATNPGQWSAMTSRQLRDANVPAAQHASDLGCSEGCPVCSLLIGNTDRHCDNISLVLVNDGWHLSPTHDMLPMLHMPIAGEVVAQELEVKKMRPTANTLDVWSDAQALAFWEAVVQEKRISRGISQLAQRNAVGLGTLLKSSEHPSRSLP